MRGYEGSESRYMNLGTRLYDPIIGRFLSVDRNPTVWVCEAFLSWSPYQYAYNSTISYKDPTDLAPQKEKGDRILQLINFKLVKYLWLIKSNILLKFKQ